MNRIFVLIIIGIFTMGMTGNVYCQDDSTKNVLKQGLLGAGTGAIAAGASGGKAGQGALIGAGTGVIGSVLLDAMTTPSSSSSGYARSAPPPQQYQQQQYDDQYYQEEPVEYYEEPAQESSSSKMLKQGLLGAGTGAIAAGASGGKAGQGALIGAGTGIIGSALLDTISQPSQPKRVYRRAAPRQQQYQPAVQTQTQYQPAQQTQNLKIQDETNPEGGKKRVIKKYDDKGKLVSEEEIYY